MKKTTLNPAAESNQTASDIIKWCNKNDMLVNASKSIVMRMNPSGTRNDIVNEDCILHSMSLKKLTILTY